MLFLGSSLYIGGSCDGMCLMSDRSELVDCNVVALLMERPLSLIVDPSNDVLRLCAGLWGVSRLLGICSDSPALLFDVSGWLVGDAEDDRTSSEAARGVIAMAGTDL